MKFKSRYIVMLMALFLVLIFLDQNRMSVPVKVLVGDPLQLGLSLIIIISMVVAAITTLCVIYSMKKKRK
jgi:uncharacterized integral membrane protein